MQEQVKYTKETWSFDCGGEGCGKFIKFKKHVDDSKETNTLFYSTVAQENPITSL